MRENYSQIQAWIGLSEGGYVNHPHDPGRATDRGITQATFDAWNRMHGKPRRAVRGISKAEAEEIIAHQYLDKVQADKLPSGLDYAVADYAVNSGPSRAAKDLQRELGVTADGVIGVQTLAAVKEVEVTELILGLCQRRMRFLRSLKTWKHFGKGWSRRVMGDQPGVQTGDNGVADRALRMVHGVQVIRPPKVSGPGKATEDTPRSFWAVLLALFTGGRK
jgi:lysozyme family protein